MKLALKHVRWMVAVAAALFVLAIPAVAWAASPTQTCTYPNQNCQPPASVLGETQTSTPTAVEGAQASRGSSLPFTGGDVAGLATIGVVAIGAGYVMHRRARTNRARIQS